MRLLSIVMPVYNEERWVERMAQRVMSEKVPLERELVTIAHGSHDGTPGKPKAVQAACPDRGVRVIRVRNAEVPSRDVGEKDLPVLLVPVGPDVRIV
jgi:glycosyltransferase involved in cell wall biosynthesis